MNLALATSADLVNPIPHDLALDETGNFYFKTGIESTAQAIKSRLRMFLGEWFLDRREGVPYFRHFFVKIRSTQVIRAIIRNVILTTPGVDSLNYLRFNFDRGARFLAIDFEAVGDNGEVIRSEDDDQFIVEI